MKVRRVRDLPDREFYNYLDEFLVEEKRRRDLLVDSRVRLRNLNDVYGVLVDQLEKNKMIDCAAIKCDFYDKDKECCCLEKGCKFVMIKPPDWKKEVK